MTKEWIPKGKASIGKGVTGVSIPKPAALIPPEEQEDEEW